MTSLNDRLAEIRANREKANDMVDRLCGDPSRWTLSVPVRDDDSDMILTQVTDKDLPTLLAAVEAFKEKCDRIIDEFEDPVYEANGYALWAAAVARALMDTLTAELGAQDTTREDPL